MKAHRVVAVKMNLLLFAVEARLAKAVLYKDYE